MYDWTFSAMWFFIEFHWIELIHGTLSGNIEFTWVNCFKSIPSFHFAIIGNVTLPGDHLWDYNLDAVSLSKIAASIFMAQHDNGKYCWSVFSAVGAEYYITVSKIKKNIYRSEVRVTLELYILFRCLQDLYFKKKHLMSTVLLSGFQSFKGGLKSTK